MVAFSKIKAGDILWDCRKTKMGNTTMSKMGSWPVRIVEVYPDTRTACVSWNHNPTKIYREREILRLRRSPIKEATSISRPHQGGKDAQ
jgi:hypothetical protein